MKVDGAKWWEGEDSLPSFEVFARSYERTSVDVLPLLVPLGAQHLRCKCHL